MATEPAGPVIRTKRLVLRAPRTEDADAISALFSNPANTVHEPHKPADPSPAAYTARIPEWEAKRKRGEMQLMVITTVPGRAPDAPATAAAAVAAAKVIGMGGINGFRTQQSGGGGGGGGGGGRLADVGVMIDGSECGKGYGKEAFAATIDYALNEAECDGVFFETMASNLPFRALVRSLGLAEAEKKLVRDGELDECSYTISKELWTRVNGRS